MVSKICVLAACRPGILVLVRFIGYHVEMTRGRWSEEALLTRRGYWVWRCCL